MKSPVHFQTFRTTLVLLATAGSGMAWPFIKKDTIAGSPEGTVRTACAFDTNGDGRPEIYGGGRDIVKVPAGTYVTMPGTYTEYYSGTIVDSDLDRGAELYNLTKFTSGTTGRLTLHRTSLLPDGTFSGDSNNHAWVTVLDGHSNSFGRVIPADMNNDGMQDIILCVHHKWESATTYQSSLYWIPGTFNLIDAPYHSIDNEGDLDDSDRFTCAAAADFNGDGWSDVVAGDSAKDILRLYDNAGDGTFGDMVNTGSETDPKEIIAGDMDGDGRPDIIVVSGTTTRKLSWRKNDGGIFSQTVNTLATSTTMDFGCPVLGDIDDDGDDDLIFTQGTSSSAEVRYCLRDGSSWAAPAVLGTVSSVGPVTCADADNDGDKDLWVVTSLSVSLFENTSPHMVSRATVQAWVGTNPSGGARMETARINGDAWDDVVCISPGNNKIMWYAGSAAGLQAPVNVPTQNLPAADFTVADFDRDGDMDIAYCLPTQTPAGGSGTGTVRIARNLGGSGAIWGDAFVMSGQPVTSLQKYSRNHTDNAAPDLVAAAPSTSWTGYCINGGDGLSWSAQALPGSSYTNLAVRGAGYRHSDYVAAIVQGGNFLNSKANYLHLTNPVGGYSQGSWIPELENTDLASNAMCRAEVDDREGVEYVIAAGTRRVYAATPDLYSSHRDTLIATAPGTVRQLAPVDWDGDSKPEILCACNGGVFLYSRSGSTWTTTTLIASGDYRGVSPVRLNGDARMDAVAVDAAGQVQRITNFSVQATLTHTEAFSQNGRVRIVPGTAQPVIALTLEHHGKQATSDEALVFKKLALKFYSATASGSSYVPGAALSDVQISALLGGITFYRDLGSPGVLDAADIPFAAAPVAVTPSAGMVALDVSSALSSFKTVLAGAPAGKWIAGLSLKSTAASAGVPRFFAYHFGSGSSSSIISTYTTALRSLYVEPSSISEAVLVEVFAPTLLQQWRMNNFGAWDSAGTAANDADPDSDGLPNIMEYVMGKDPKANTAGISSNVPLEVTFLNQTTPVQLDLRLNTTYDSKVKLTIQNSFNMQSWSTLSTRTGTGAWSIAPNSTTLLSGGGRTWYKFSATVIPQYTWKQYFRVKAEELP